MNTAQETTAIPSKAPVFSIVQDAPAKPASESIASMWEMLHQSSRTGAIYDALPTTIKTTACFHAGLKKRHIGMSLSEMEYDERRKLLRAINDICNALEPLAHTPLENFK